MGYIDDRGIDGLRRYTYKSKDLSITYVYVLSPIWDAMIPFFPMWLAPNVITLSGLFLTIISYALVIIYNPTLSGPCPDWVYLVIGVFLLIYQTLDNLDGRQARRTQSSSPLGELFDHGCDVLTVTLSGVAVASTLQLGPGWKTFLLIWSAGMLPFFLGTLEEYHTGALILRQINGPIEGLLGMAGLHIATFFLGPDIWFLNVSPESITGIEYFPLNNLILLLLPVPVLPTIYFNLLYIASKVQEQRKSVFEVFLHLIPFVTFSILSALWIFLSPELVETYPILFFSLLGTLFSLLGTRLIFCYLCQYEYKWFNEYLVPLFICVGHAFVMRFLGQPLIEEIYLLLSYVIVAGCGYLHFSISIIREMCAALEISFFTITNRAVPRV